MREVDILPGDDRPAASHGCASSLSASRVLSVDGKGLYMSFYNKKRSELRRRGRRRQFLVSGALKNGRCQRSSHRHGLETHRTREQCNSYRTVVFCSAPTEGERRQDGEKVVRGRCAPEGVPGQRRRRRLCACRGTTLGVRAVHQELARRRRRSTRVARAVFGGVGADVPRRANAAALREAVVPKGRGGVYASCERRQPPDLRIQSVLADMFGRGGP